MKRTLSSSSSSSSMSNSQLDENEVLSRGFNAEIRRKDIETLRGRNLLNDEIINFYISLVCDQIRERGENSPAYKRCYAFSTFFYPKLAKEGRSQSTKVGLEKWTFSNTISPLYPFISTNIGR